MTYPSETIKAITELLFIGSEKVELSSSDLVIVLGNEFIEGTIKELHDLYTSGVVEANARIILTGATGLLNAGSEPECERLYDCAVEKYHMPREMFIKENRATNAYENLVFSKEIVESLGGFSAFNRILFIGKAFMLRRVSMYASALDYPKDKLRIMLTRFKGIVIALYSSAGASKARSKSCLPRSEKRRWIPSIPARAGGVKYPTVSTIKN